MNIRGLVMGVGLLLASHAGAQYSSLFGAEHTAWTTKLWDMPGPYTDSLAYAGDTLVEGMHYRKFERFSAYGPASWSGPWPDCVGYVGEDTVAGKVWFFTLFEPVPVVIMDLSLEVGDTFTTFSQFGDTFEVIATYTDALGRYTVEFDAPIALLSEPENFKFIEGYGPNRGVAYADGNCFWSNPYTICQYKDGQVVGHAGDPALASVCRLFQTGINELGDGPLVTAGPNPSNGRFNLSYPAQPEGGLLEVLDATGGVVYRSRLAAGSQVHNVPLEGAAAGLYLCRVRWGAQAVSTRIILAAP